MQKKEQSKYKIIKATLGSLNSNEPNQVTTKIIGKKSGFSTAAIHHYFDTKDNLIYLSFAQVFDSLKGKVNNFEERNTDAKIRLDRVFNCYLNPIYNRSKLNRIWLQLWGGQFKDKKIDKLLTDYNQFFTSKINNYLVNLGLSQQSANYHGFIIFMLLRGLWVELNVLKKIKLEGCLDNLNQYIDNIRELKDE